LLHICGEQSFSILSLASSGVRLGFSLRSAEYIFGIYSLAVDLKTGTTQENLVENVKQYSRVTILKTIADLENEGFIEISKDENTPKKYHLYVNRKNVLVSLIEDLDHFKESFFNLIDETKGTQTLNDNISVSKRIQEYNLIDALLMPYKCLINTCIMSDLVLRPKEPLDINILYKKFAIILTEIPEIQIKLYESISTHLCGLRIRFNSTAI
jgi:predicted transcriptional regulator